MASQAPKVFVDSSVPIDAGLRSDYTLMLRKTETNIIAKAPRAGQARRFHHGIAA